MEPVHVINLDSLIPLLKAAYDMIRQCLDTYTVVIAGHTYTAFHALLALLIFFWVTDYIWGTAAEDEED